MIIYDTYHDDTTDVTYHIIDTLKRHDPIYSEHVYIAYDNTTMCTGINCDVCIFHTSKDCEDFSENTVIMTSERFPRIRAKYPELFV